MKIKDLKKYADENEEIKYYIGYDNGDFSFSTEKRGFCLIRNGENILKPFQKGKAIDCCSFPSGDFSFKTEKQGWIKITKEELNKINKDNKILKKLEEIKKLLNKQ